MVTKHRQPRFSLWRINALIVIVIIMTGAIAFRLFDVAVNDHAKYLALADDQHNYIKSLLPDRGTIYATDRAGGQYPLATNQELYFVYAVPKDITDPQATAEKLVDIFREASQREEELAKHALVGFADEYYTPPTKSAAGLEEEKKKETEELKTRLDKPEDAYEALQRRLPADLADKIRALDLAAGIKLETESWRYYPENELAAQTLGFVSFAEDELKGHYGIEGYFEDRLAGHSGLLAAQRDSEGKVISVLDQEFDPPRDGDDIVLTIDRNIQFIVESKLAEATKKYRAEQGTVTVVNPKTGAILAMASFPTYNPNAYNMVKAEDQGVFNISSVFDIYEPGSVGKPVLMSAALDAGLVTPDTTYNDKGSIKVGPHTIHNFGNKAWGRQTMTRVIEQSLNLGMAFVTEKLGKERAYDYLDRFGFTNLTGITLDSETQSKVKEIKDWSDADLAVSGFGQGYAVNTLQMVMAYATIANDGKLMQPYIVDKFIKPDGTEEPTRPQEIRQVISPSAAVTTAAMLVSSVDRGIASVARVPGYRIAGKTGTAQVPKEDGTGYSNEVITSFAGFFPHNDPQFAMIVKFDKPHGGSLGSTTAGPVFSQIAGEILNYYHIPPE